MRIVIVRHAQSEVNKMNNQIPIYCGRYNTPLTKAGKEAASKLSKNPYINEIQTLYVSDLTRAIETAKLARPDKKLEIRNELTERSLGIFEGKIIEEIKQKYPEYFEKKELMNFRFDMKAKAPKGESYGDVCKRLLSFLNSLELTANETIGIFSHFNVIRCLLYLLLELKEEEIYQLEIRNCDTIVVEGNQVGKFILVHPSLKELKKEEIS